MLHAELCGLWTSFLRAGTAAACSSGVYIYIPSPLSDSTDYTSGLVSRFSDYSWAWSTSSAPRVFVRTWEMPGRAHPRFIDASPARMLPCGSADRARVVRPVDAACSLVPLHARAASGVPGRLRPPRDERESELPAHLTAALTTAWEMTV